jgi:hypothetical protein
MKTENHQNHTNNKKNETKTKTVSNKDRVKDSNQVATKKPDGQDNVVEKSKSKSKSKSEAGKGDKLRRGITQDEWGKKWEEIFKPKKK